MSVLVLAALAGLLGSGPLSHARAELPGLLTVEYDRFARFETSESITVRLAATATAGNAVRLSLNREFLESSRLESVLPSPVRVESAAGRLIYVFAVAEPRAPMAVTFTFQPRGIGSHHAVVGLESAAEPRRVGFRQLVYP